MAALSTTSRRHRHQRARVHLVPIMLGGFLALPAIALVAYLLWPTWATRNIDLPGRLPVSIGDTIFNVPTAAIRMNIQRHSGPQERVDLSFVYPSLEPPEAPRHVTADTADQAIQPIDRLFLSIAAHNDALSPENLVRTIYPRYLEQATPLPADGLSRRAFRTDTPYSNEDLFSAETPALVARCTRDAATPGTCLSERRIGGADLTFRFPRSWLAQWRDVATAMDTVTAQLRGPKN